jgi:hypothetical protein
MLKSSFIVRGKKQDGLNFPGIERPLGKPSLWYRLDNNGNNSKFVSGTFLLVLPALTSIL